MNMKQNRNPDLYISLQIFSILFVPLKQFICILNRKLEHFMLKQWHPDLRKDDSVTLQIPVSENWLGAPAFRCVLTAVAVPVNGTAMAASLS